MQKKNEEQLAQQIASLEQRIAGRMSKEAWERYRRVKLAHPHIAYQALALLTNTVQQSSEILITDEKLKNLLKKIK